MLRVIEMERPPVVLCTGVFYSTAWDTEYLLTKTTSCVVTNRSDYAATYGKSAMKRALLIA